MAQCAETETVLGKIANHLDRSQGTCSLISR